MNRLLCLGVDKSVPIEYAVEVMDIAYQANGFKIVLATTTKTITCLVTNINEEMTGNDFSSPLSHFYFLFFWFKIHGSKD